MVELLSAPAVVLNRVSLMAEESEASVRIHTYSAGGRDAVTHPDTPPETALHAVVAVDGGEHVYQVGSEAEIDLDHAVGELFGSEPGHVLVHHCREIAVTVDYAGAAKLVTAHPATRVKAVLIEAIKAFGLDPAASADLVLRLPGLSDELVVTNPIGAYVPKGSCAVTLDLVHLVRPQG